MVRQKLKKICAGVLVASMLLQTLPAQVQAEEKVNTTVMASEGQQAAQTPNGSETQYNGTTSENESGKNNSNETSTEQPDDASKNNSKSEAEENQQENESNKSDSNIEESAQENTKQTDAEQEATADEANPKDATGNGIQVIDNKVTLTSTADFINLSIQPAENYETAEITITRGTNTSFDLTETVNGKTFQGFGSEKHPFKGTIKITSSGSGIDIPINRPFFEYLDQSATINVGLYLKAKGRVNGPLLAANYVKDGNLAVAEPKQISLMIGAEKEDNNFPSFGGIIGIMSEGTSLSLSVVNKITEANTTITGTGNLGFFCNTMEAGANLTIASYIDGNSTNSGSTGSTPTTIDYDISTTDGHAGGLVGEMQDGATLAVTPALNLTGNVTTTETEPATGELIEAAGGLIGAAENPIIALNNQVTRTGTIEGTSESGGFIGRAVYNTGLELDLSNISISGITISNGNHAGGYFGVLNFDSTTGGTIAIKNLSQTELIHTGESWQFGGVIGQYSANSQSSTLKLESPKVTISSNGAVTALGGIIGFVAGSGAHHGLSKATSSYVEISGATVTADLTTDLKKNGDSYFGGLVGELGQAEGQGHFLSVSGTTKVSGNDNGKASKLGGILGTSTKGVLRISGTTDLSDLKIAKTGTECGQIAGSIDGTIVYALGSGNGTGGNGYDWKYIRPAAVPVSDIGSYGEVIRLDGSKLKETDGSSADSNTLFTNDSASHQLSVAYTPGETLTINNTRDLAAVAVLLQQGNTEGLLSKSITVNCNVDLTETGIYSLLRDNGSQMYTGTFNGNNHTITLAAGEAYGYLSDSTLAANENGTSATVGIGQIYNHSTIGFIPYCNGKVQNLILNGSIYFHNVSNGVDVRCGAVAGYTDGATFENVTVDTKIVYRDGAGGAGLKVMSIGGFLGRAKGKTTFTRCSMQGTISSSSGCYDFAIGGYVAVGEEGANISFSNCGISNATIKHEKFKDNSNAPNALFGGLIGCMTGNVTINGLTINHLQMESYATETAGGLLGYYWRKNSATDSVSINNLEVLNSKLDVKGKFGGLVYSTDAYWKIGNGTGANGIKFSASNSFLGKTDEANPSALLVCSTIQDEANKKYDKAYIEILKDGLKIEENAVNVTLTGGDYFDDIAGKTKYGEDGNNAVVSIGLTSPNATTATLIDQDKNTCNTWTNQCNVNNGKPYTNKNTRYYYNVDYYREKEGKNSNITDINSAGKLLLRSLYVYAQPNLQQYFVKGSDDFQLTGTIDLRGVSYYPMSRAITIQDATVIFDYTNMNTNTVKKYNDSNQQHYQMQTGLFSKISQKFTVNKLTLQGTFGKYEVGKAGVLICDSIAQESANKDQAGITITNLKLDGIQCNDGTNLPLLVNSVGSNTAISMNDVTFTRGAYTTSGLTGNKVASALMGQVGSSTAQKISLEFSNMDLNRAGNDSIFNTAIFATAFQYGDGASGGSYNFESTTEKITFGKEISNGVKSIGNLSGYNRNPYSQKNMTGQVWYLDTFGNTTAGSYVGADKAAINTENESGNKPANSPQDFSGYLPYIGRAENSADKYYELDINQKAVYLVDGCGTYGHPWVIQNVSRKGSVQTLFTGEDQMMTVMKLLDDTGRNGTAIKINTTILTTKMDGQGGIDVHTGDASDDIVFIKNGNTWKEATLVGNRYVQKTDSNVTLTNEQVMAYLRNGYFQIKKDLTLNVAQFTGFGKNNVSRAFSGVIVGDTADRKITLTGVNTTGEVGGLIRYSQGSVVKNLTIVLDKVTFNGNSTETFFGGVIGWVIGGDSIIDNVTLTVNSVNKGSSASNLTAVGGYVGMVGGYVKTVGSTTIDQSKKGGGVVFRNISSAGLTSISGSSTNTEAGDGNTNYYWNPYVGRVFDGYACAEESCSGMGTNTDKNYTISKLDKNVKLKITGNKGVNTIAGNAYPNSTITLDSTQSIWLLSAIVNSGFGAKTAGGDFALTSSNGTDYRVNASYYGRTRTGTYDGVGTAPNQADATDENDYWGGKLIKDGREVDRRKYSTSYLSTYVETQNNSADPKAVTYSLTMDNNGRSVTFVKGIYDLSTYGNGFRGIGHNYGLPADIRKSRALRLQNQINNDSITVAGNGATIQYSRTIYEMSGNDISVSQAGFFTQCLANSGATYTVNGLNFKDVTLKKNIGKDGVALGIAFARDGAYSPNSLMFEGVNVTKSAIDQADQGAAVIGYMSNLTKNTMITFTGCSVEGFAAGTDNGNSTNKMNHCGAFIGKTDSPVKGATSTDRKVEFKNCTATNINMYNVQNGGLFAGYVNGTCTIKGGSANTGTITSRTAVGGGYSMGGLIGKAESILNIEGTTETPMVSVKNISIRETKDVNSTSKSYAGGVAGSAASTNIQNVDVENIRLAGKDLGGLIGCVNGSADVKNVKISNSYLANCSKDSNQNAVGGFFGIINGSNRTFNGFNLLSKDNVIGYAVNGNSLVKSVSSEALSSLSADSIGLLLKDDTYATYNSLTANASLESGTPCGIWVGNANNNPVKIDSASRQGNYSAVNNIGAGKNESSYVIYADYTGQSTTSSTLNTKPDAIVTVENTPLTGDGATKVNGTAVRDSIISDIMTNPSLMKGYYGGDQSRPLDEIVKKFGTNGDYSSRLSNYQKEEPSYKSEDFPILVLNATTKSELNSIVNNYISMLTNAKQEQSKRCYDKIEPKTYKYENNAWNLVSAENQTMSWNATDGVSINRGKYDNNKQQITILDVSYEISTEVYHLYIPVLVKKLMDVECSVKVVNGAAGYDPATDEKATLNSFGENYTAHISYTYKWMVSEWQSMLENGDSLLWNFDKTVKLGEFKTLDRSKIHLTLVDMNTQGTQTSYHQSTLGELSTVGVLTDDTLNLAEMAKQGKSPYICDLLPLEATESATGGFKKVESADPGAVLRIWNETENTFIYYAAKSDADTKDTKYYNVTLNTKCGLNDILPVKEEYYLVMNCTEGNATTPMLNTTLELNQSYSNQQIPTKVTGNFNVVYLLGDFYKLDNVTLNSESTTQNQEMVSGSNDSIKVIVSSKVSAAANENEFGSYVNDRSIYYQYSLQTVNQSGNPVDMKGAASIPTLKLEKKNADGTVTETHELKQLTNLSGTENGFITQFGENGYIITIKAPGEWYTGATITAEMSFSYNSTDMNQQFPVRKSNTENTGVKFKVDAVMAYQQDSLGSSGISASATEEKLYYQLKEAQAKLSYDSYNITSKDGNTSQLGINGRENDNAAMEISSRALLNVTDFTSFNLTDESNSTYPYYLEGELTLAQKTDSENGTSYKDVAIGDYLSEFVIESAGTNVDVTSEGLGLQENNTVYKFRIRLTKEQVNKILDTPLLVNIKYKVKTGKELEDIDGGQYANYKVTLSATLKNKNLEDLLNVKPSDYLIYTNAKVYLKIVG